MRQWIRHSFRNQILVTVLVVTLVPLLLCGLLMLSVQVRRISEDQAAQAEQRLDGMEKAFSGLLQQIDGVTGSLSESTVVRSVLRNATPDSRILYQVLSRDTVALQKFCSFSIRFADGSCRYATDPAPEPLDPGWGILRAAGTASGLVMQPGSGDRLELARAVRSYDGGILGYVCAELSREGFEHLFRELLGLNGNLLIVDRFWDPVYASQGTPDAAAFLREQWLHGEELGDPGGECRYVLRQLPQWNLALILQQPRLFTAQALRTVRQVGAAMGILSILLTLGYALHFSRSLAEPVHRLDQAMEQVQQGDLTVSIDLNRQDELGRLASSFNAMTRECQANLERQKQLNSVRIQMMQAQLNPHFLYNTLDSIKWLGVANGIPEISTMATDLASILRESISGEKLIPLEQELEIIDRYLEIQYLRFEDRFVCEIDIPEKFQHCLMPKLSLQPLVENAILHGVADLEEGYIKITAREEAGDLILCVSDNGCGMPAEILEALRNPDRQLPGHHLGLHNVDQIAKLHFGPRYGISADAVPGAGSRICLRIPMKKEEPSC